MRGSSPSSLPLLFFFILLGWCGDPVSCQADPPVPDDCKASPYEEGRALVCSLSAINSPEEKTNFAVIPSVNTLSLTIRCRNDLPSQLEADGFRSLGQLRKLTLDGCMQPSRVSFLS